MKFNEFVDLMNFGSGSRVITMLCLSVSEVDNTEPKKFSSPCPSGP